MIGQSKDIQRLWHMVKFCEKIAVAIRGYDACGKQFGESVNYSVRDLCSFYLLQIGELSAGLSDGLKERYAAIPWKSIRGFRNIVAHKYGTVDKEMLWDIIHEDVPQLEKACMAIVQEAIPEAAVRLAQELAEEDGIFPDGG